METQEMFLVFDAVAEVIAPDLFAAGTDAKGTELNMEDSIRLAALLASALDFLYQKTVGEQKSNGYAFVAGTVSRKEQIVEAVIERWVEGNERMNTLFRPELN